MNDLYYPLRSLQEGHWFKLICGASYQHLPAIRNLALAYTLAGADCVDVAADPAVIASAKAGIAAAQALWADNRGTPHPPAPWLMVSFNDGEDPHFRKAEFDATRCPADCARPCEQVCPAQAIVFGTAVDPIPADPIALRVAPINRALAPVGTQHSPQEHLYSGVIADRCYGCGRCLPLCPIQQITARSYVASPAAIAPLILESGIDAIEIHTQVGRLTEFQRLWTAIVPWVHQLKLVAISCPDGDGLIDYLRSLHATISPLPCALIWQTDGRPMSGDIGIGATRAAVKLGQKVLAAELPGFVQLAGGTNHYTVEKLRSRGLLPPLESRRMETGLSSAPPSSHSPSPHSLSSHSPSSHTGAYIAGIAYGSYARTLLSPVLDRLADLEQGPTAIAPLPTTSLCLEAVPELLRQGVSLAHTLVTQLKAPHDVPPFSDQSEPPAAFPLSTPHFAP